jgi:voltage-gated sodium channel
MDYGEAEPTLLESIQRKYRNLTGKPGRSWKYDDRPEFQSVYQQLTAASPEEEKKKQHHVANQKWFNSMIGVVIVANAICIGTEVDNSRGDGLKDRFVFFLLEVVFIGIFAAEMFLRQSLLGWNYFLDAWNVMDYFLVVVGFVDVSVSLIYSEQADIKVLTAFRIIRMVRVVRNVRLLRMFRELWMVVRGFFDSLATLGWVSVLLVLSCYICAVYMVMVVAKSPDNQEIWFDSTKYIGSVPRAMWSFLEVVTFDKSHDRIARPIISLNHPSILVFMFLAVMCSFGLLNVIVGVIVERTLQVALENEEEVSKEIEKCEKFVMESMGEEFVKADVDGNGELEMEEFKKAIREPGFAEMLRLIEVPIVEAEELFFLMDVDKSKSISADEFVEGIQRVKGGAKGKDMIQLISSTQRQLRRAGRITERINRLNRIADNCLTRLDDMWQKTEHELEERARSKRRQEQLDTRCKEKQKILDHIEANRTLVFPALGREE